MPRKLSEAIGLSSVTSGHDRVVCLSPRRGAV